VDAHVDHYSAADSLADYVEHFVRGYCPDGSSEQLELKRVVAYQLITGERSVDPALAESYVLAAAAGREA
jgi:hypothetical protein